MLILVLYCGVGLLFLAVGAGKHTPFAGQAYVMVVANLATIVCFDYGGLCCSNCTLNCYTRCLVLASDAEGLILVTG